MFRQAHLKLIAGHSVKHGIRGGAGLISIFFTLVTGLILAYVVMLPLEMLDATKSQLGERYTSLTAEQKAEIDVETNTKVIEASRKAINWALKPNLSEPQLDFLTNTKEINGEVVVMTDPVRKRLIADQQKVIAELAAVPPSAQQSKDKAAAQQLMESLEDHSGKPAIVSAFLVLMFLFTPFLVCLGGFNQTSSDIDSKGLRFLLIRTERPNIFLGRFIGTYLFTAVVFGILFGILALYMAVNIKVHPVGDMLFWLAGGYLRVMLLALPYMAICAWVSCAIDSGFGSLMIALLLTYMVPGFIGVASNINEKVGYLHYTNPWGYKWMLMQPLGPHFLGGLAAMLGFTFLFLFLGNRYFGKRDL